MRETVKPPLVLVLVALTLLAGAYGVHGYRGTATTTGRTPQPGGVLQPRDMARLEVGRVLWTCGSRRVQEETADFD
jgi:hypothetical protein